MVQVGKFLRFSKGCRFIIESRKFSTAQPSATKQFRYGLLKEEHLPAAVEIHHINRKDENITNGFGCYFPCPNEEFEVFGDFFKRIIEQNMSLGAFDEETDELAGCTFSFLSKKPATGEVDWFSETVETTMKDARILELFDYIGSVEHKFDLYNYFNSDLAHDIFFIGINPQYRRHGLGLKMMKEMLELGDRMVAEKHPTAPGFSCGIATSPYNQKILNKLEFEQLYFERFNQHTCKDGRNLADRIPPNYENYDKVTVVGRRYTGKGVNVIDTNRSKKHDLRTLNLEPDHAIEFPVFTRFPGVTSDSSTKIAESVRKFSSSTKN